MTTRPAIAIRRREDAVTNFTTKLEKLESILGIGELDKLPLKMSITAFAKWEDSALGVASISKAIIYDDADDYLPLKARMDVALKRLALLRKKSGKKANLESELRRLLGDANARAEKYLNQYSSVRAELVDLKSENEQLQQKHARKIATESKIAPLRDIKLMTDELAAAKEENEQLKEQLAHATLEVSKDKLLSERNNVPPTTVPE